jgi:enoyl-[acyl-carrier protein] reductase II
VEGELEIGQISGLINDILPVDQIFKNIIAEFSLAQKESAQIVFNS